VREETQVYMCVYCRQPIRLPHLPAVRLKDGTLLHVECWEVYRESQIQQTS